MHHDPDPTHSTTAYSSSPPTTTLHQAQEGSGFDRTQARRGGGSEAATGGTAQASPGSSSIMRRSHAPSIKKLGGGPNGGGGPAEHEEEKSRMLHMSLGESIVARRNAAAVRRSSICFVLSSSPARRPTQSIRRTLDPNIRWPPGAASSRASPSPTGSWCSRAAPSRPSSSRPPPPSAPRRVTSSSKRCPSGCVRASVDRQPASQPASLTPIRNTFTPCPTTPAHRCASRKPTSSSGPRAWRARRAFSPCCRT